MGFCTYTDKPSLWAIPNPSQTLKKNMHGSTCFASMSQDLNKSIAGALVVPSALVPRAVAMSNHVKPTGDSGSRPELSRCAKGHWHLQGLRGWQTGCHSVGLANQQRPEKQLSIPWKSPQLKNLLAHDFNASRSGRRRYRPVGFTCVLQLLQRSCCCPWLCVCSFLTSFFGKGSQNEGSGRGGIDAIKLSALLMPLVFLFVCTLSLSKKVPVQLG